MAQLRKNLFDLMTRQQGIREGFRDQHLVVLPDSVRKSAERHPLLRALFVTDAGVFPRAGRHLVSRPKGVATTLLILCSAGRGWAEISGQKFVVEAGTVLWFPARQPHAYGSDSASPWTIEWAHFTGLECAAWREFLQLPAAGGSLSLPASVLAQISLGPIWSHLERGYSSANLIEASLALRTTFAALSRPGPSSRSDDRPAVERVAASTEWIRAHLSQSIRLAELAQLAAVSIPHYCALFKRQTGFAPIDWLIRLRIQRACQLLDTTTETIAAIGARAGFPDPYHFTRSFRRIMGRSPRDYRRIPKG